MLNYKIIFHFWFGDKEDDSEVAEEQRSLWWSKNPLVDKEIKERFETSIEAFSRGELDKWKETTQGVLALILITDQFPRNIYRGLAKSFALDKHALKLSKELLRLKGDEHLRPVERIFAYMPLEHSESMADQEENVKRFKDLIGSLPEEKRTTFEGYLNFAVRHREIIDRFGRFPHRNEMLGRESTPEEMAFLKEPGSSF